MEWIKCSDRLPENDDEVLVYNIKDGINLGEFDSDNVRKYIEDDGTEFVTSSGWEVYYAWAPKMTPTHWMPLPKDPDECKYCQKIIDECDCPPAGE